MVQKSVFAVRSIILVLFVCLFSEISTASLKPHSPSLQSLQCSMGFLLPHRPATQSNSGRVALCGRERWMQKHETPRVMKNDNGNDLKTKNFFKFTGYRLEQESMLETFKSLGVVPKRNMEKFKPFLDVLNASITNIWSNVSVKALLKESSVASLRDVMTNSTSSAALLSRTETKTSLKETSLSALKELMQYSSAPSSAFARLKSRNSQNTSSIRMGVFTNFSADMWRTASNWTKIRKNEQIFIYNTEELDQRLDEGISIYRLKIHGRSQPWRQNEKGFLVDSQRFAGMQGMQQHDVHPVLQAIRARQQARSRPGKRSDSMKIGLAIEGGGLRGSVTAGMACAINDLGVADSFDLVLGSSAGSIVGSYLVARADHRTTYQFFCNYLTTSKNYLNGTSWLDISRLTKLLSPLRPDFSPKSPVMLLEYPMKHIMQELLPLNWTIFEQNNKHQPMKVIASGLFSEGPVILGTEEDSFNDLASLCDCIKASCMLPGIAGIQPIWIKGSSSLEPENLKQGCELWINYELSRSLWSRAQSAFANQLSSRGTSSASSSQEDESVGLSRAEFIQVMRAIGVHAGTSDLLELFHMVDVNKDGFIEEEELKNVLVWIVWKQLVNIKEFSNSLAGFVPEVEPLVDALVYEPIPYRSAVSSGCSHVLVLRSYPDGNLMPKSLLGIFERLIAPKCLDPFPKVKKHLHDAGHSIIYAKDILLLNQQASKGFHSSAAGGAGQDKATDPHLFAIAPLDVDDVVSQLALDRNVLLAGILQGFARAYDILRDPSQSLTGAERAIDLFLPLHYRFLVQIGEAERSRQGQGRDVKALLPADCWSAVTQRLGQVTPASWSIGVHYFQSVENTFGRGEEVVLTRGDGRRIFGSVIGWGEEERRYIVATGADKVKNSNSFNVYYTMCEVDEMGKIEQTQ
eukprot:757606-Hanusia_phi.AAC.2